MDERKEKQTLPHNNTTHKNLNRPNAFQRHFSFTRSLPQSHMMTQLILAHSIRVVDFVAQNQKGHFGEFFHGQQSVEFGFGFGEAFVVFGVDEEDYSADFREVIFPQAACYI